MTFPKMKTLGIDLRCLPADGSAGGGVAHAARAVTEEIVKQWKGDVVLYVPRGVFLSGKVLAPRLRSGQAPPKPYTDVLRDIESHQIVWLDGIGRSSLIHGLAQSPCDLLFVLSGAVTPGLPVPAVPWVHDCDIFDHPEWFPQSWLKRQVTTRMFLRGIRRAPHVFAASEYTKQAVERLVPSVRGRVTVTGEGGDAELAMLSAEDLSHATPLRPPPFAALRGTRSGFGGQGGVRLPEAKSRAVAAVRSRGMKGRYVLVLGTLEPRKNIPMICRIWPDVVKEVPDVNLIIAGQDGWKTEEIHEAIKECQSGLEPLDSKLILIQKTQDSGQREFTEDDRRDLLLAADIVLVPSFSEGFGLVALEAIQAGTPVIASNRGALPEVVGTGEWLIDPTDDDAWRDMIIRVLTDNPLQQDVTARQSLRRELFSWERTARAIVEAINAKRTV